ncbi:MAG: hypothetical protein ACRCZF_10315 [Gemmataceae bacterium]
MIRTKCWLGLVLSVLAIAGCSDGKLKVYPVSGTVLYNDQPLAGVDVAFHAVDPKNAVSYPPHATTDANGKFSLMSYVADDGAPAGEYTVAIAVAVEVAGADDGGDQTKKITFQVPAKYQRKETSGLQVSIKPQPNVLEPFKLVGPPKPATKK